MSDLAARLDQHSAETLRPQLKKMKDPTPVATQAVNQALGDALPIVPPNYVPVKLTSTLGKLTAPPVLHFRNYTMEEALLLAQLRNGENHGIVIKILNQCILEKFDCALLHLEEVIEIMLNIYGTWWKPEIEGFYYAVDESKPMEGENRSIATIPVNNIKTDSIRPDVSEPITIVDPVSKVKVGFTLSRLGYSVLIEGAVREKYLQEEAQFNDLLWTLKENERREKAGKDPIHYDLEELQRYEDLQERKLQDMVLMSRAMLIQTIDDVPLNTIEEKMAAMPKVDLMMWESYSQAVETHFKFGVRREVTFECSVTGKDIVRRFPFRYVDLVPAVDPGRVQSYSVTFGR